MNLSLSNFIHSQFPNAEVKYLERTHFSENAGEVALKELVCAEDRPTLDALVAHKYLCLSATACLLHYLREAYDITFLSRSLHLDFRTCDGFLMIDPMTVRCLELIEPNRPPSTAQRHRPGGKTINSLFDVLNHTLTPQGSRLLKSNLIQAPSDLSTIRFRQSCVTELLSNEELYFGVSKALLAFGDLDPILSHFIRISASQTPQSLQAKEMNSKNTIPSASKPSSRKNVHSSPELVSNTLIQAQGRISTLIRLKRNLAGLGTLKNIISTSDHPLLVALAHTLSHPDLYHIYNILNDSMSDVNAAPNATVRFRKSVQKRDVIFALKDGVNGLLDAARRVYTERVQDVQELFEEYQHNFPNLALKLASNASRGYYLFISESRLDVHTGNTAAKVIDLQDSDEESDEIFPEHSARSTAQKSHDRIHQLPDMFILRNKVGNKLVFTTEDLVALNGRLSEAVNELSLLTSQLLEGVQISIAEKIGCLYKFGEGIALLDMIYSFATYVTLSPEKCCCPEFLETKSFEQIQIVKGYHPLILASSRTATGPQAPSPASLQSSSEVLGVPNDVKTSKSGSFLHIITGRNNSGKTTYLLQVGTLCIMAHMGCYIPASFASMSLVDRLLTRITSSDGAIATSDATANSSAFYREMCDTAYILNSSTSNSLVLLDEIGKSTSSDDGVPICFALCESLLEKQITTFFATHFLDMACKLEDLYPEVLVHMMSVQSENPNSAGEHPIKSSFRMVDGCQTESGYGIDLAASAGWPPDTITLACQLRENEAELLGGERRVSIEFSRRAKIDRLRRNVVEQLLIAKRSDMDSVNLHMFLHKLAVRFRQKMDEISDGAAL